MIQRKQSIWLLIAALLNAGVFYFDLYRYHNVLTGTTPIAPTNLNVSNHYPSLLIAMVMTALPFITIFMFGNRKRQIRMSFASILAILSFTSMMLWRVTNLGRLTPPPTSGNYWIGAILPVIALVFIIMAMVAIRKDEKLVKSADRLR